MLIIDYEDKEDGPVAFGDQPELTREFRNVGALKMRYSNDRYGRPPLRLIHVQNAEWAKEYFRERFMMLPEQDITTALFDNLDADGQARPKSQKPVLRAQSSGVQRDPWRGVKRAAFRFDFLRPRDRKSVV